VLQRPSVPHPRLPDIDAQSASVQHWLQVVMPQQTVPVAHEL
jgi:hypothetical protein